jgi:hypothetical protein
MFFGLMLSSTLHILSTDYPLPYYPMIPHSLNYSNTHQITLYFGFLDVLPILSSVHIFPTNLPLKASNVYSLASALNIRAITVLIRLPIVSISLTVWSLMNHRSLPSIGHSFLLLPSPQLSLPVAPSVVIQMPDNLPLIPAPPPLKPSPSRPPAPSPSPPHTSSLQPGCFESGSPNTLPTTSVSDLQVAPASSSFMEDTSVPALHQMVTRSKTGSLRPKQYADFQLFYSTRHPLRAKHITLISEASKSPAWRAAMNQDFDALLAQNTWSLCPLPAGRHAVRNKWVYKLKQKPDGSIDCYKARLVAKGFDQRCGLDYIEMFSPVIKPSTVRVVLAIAVHFNWPVRQLDICNTFLHRNLQEDVYTTQPQGFVHPDFPQHVCKLNKALYGLKQASRAWFNRLSDSLLEFSFTQSLVDTSLFLFKQGIARFEKSKFDF